MRFLISNYSDMYSVIKKALYFNRAGLVLGKKTSSSVIIFSFYLGAEFDLKWIWPELNMDLLKLGSRS